MKREPSLDSILREQINLHAKAKRLRVPAIARGAMVAAINHLFRAVYDRRREKAARKGRK